MRPFDWIVVVAYIGWIVVDGLRRSHGTDKVDGSFLASRSLPWWAGGLSLAVGILIYGTLRHVGGAQALELAGATGRLKSIDFSFNLSEKYTFWSGMIGGLFLMLSYFGCDQSQVQRYLTAKSIDEARQSLLMSAYVKIPLQLLILGSGVLEFVFYLFHTPPMLFNRVYDTTIAASASAGTYSALQERFDREAATRRDAAARGDREAFLASDERIRGIRA